MIVGRITDASVSPVALMPEKHHAVADAIRVPTPGRVFDTSPVRLECASLSKRLFTVHSEKLRSSAVFNRSHPRHVVHAASRTQPESARFNQRAHRFTAREASRRHRR